ncbi:hypothetical protein Q5P01_002906 [Channa striata]|uniref:Toll-like receptor 2 n=1 Tax=Channa striata TaxID=64152 RepID=A0AA88T6N6_CHASR|nr:hypothetical protein Q5P01_002906 [Channa striata]
MDGFLLLQIGLRMRRQTNFYSTILLLLFFFFLCLGQRSRPDGERPSCNRCDLHLSCNCSHGGFNVVPMVTDRALALDLSFNNINMVNDDDLTGHTQLRVLSLHGNRLAVIHPSAFDPLFYLEELDLSDNQLKVINHKWFSRLGVLQRLNLLNNPYSCLGSPPVFQGLVSLRRLAFGGPHLRTLKKGELSGVTQLEELSVHANNLTGYESGTLAAIWPLGRVSLSLYEPFLTNTALASAVLGDVSYPETPLIIEDVRLDRNESVQPFREPAKKRVRHLTFRNIYVSDEAIVDLLVVLDNAPVTSITVDGVTLMGRGKKPAGPITGIDEFLVKNVVVLPLFHFVSFLKLSYLLAYPRKISVINTKVFVMPCATSFLLKNLQYLDLSDNILTDLTLAETLCYGAGTMKDLRVLNISGNAFKSLSTMNRLVEKLYKLTHLDISRTGYNSMPQNCSWPSTLRFLNISGAQLTKITPCLPTTLEVLDLSNNNLKDFTLTLPSLQKLHLSGNKFLRLPSGSLFPNLQIMTIRSNTLVLFGPSDLQAYRRLQNFQAGQNKFECSCEFVPFLQQAFKGVGDVHLTDGEESYVCDSPLYLQGEPRLHAFWYLKMTWTWLKAKHSSRRRRQCRQQLLNEETSETMLSFDAFVSYSERDSSWVENYLVPELEGPRETDEDSRSPRPLNLCLHKRDFLPGHWIVDNIMSAMERSRRTVFILSENFVQSDWCRYELDFSHFWMFDGNAGRDATILILLEPLSKHDVPKRFCKLRKLMSSTTYIEWPQEEERREEFWRSLRHALRGEDDDWETNTQ